MASTDDIVSVQQQGVQNLGKIYQALLSMQQLTFVPVPATSVSAGETGQVAASATFLYICVAPSTWRRVAISAF